MKIVGVTGSIGSGKTTFSQFLADNAPSSQHYESWLVIAEVANAWRSATPTHPKSSDNKAINAWLQVLPPIATHICHQQVSFEQLYLTAPKLQKSPENYAKLIEYLDLMAAQPELQKGEITEQSKETFRSLLQWLGGYFEKEVHTGIWYKEIVRRIQTNIEAELVTVGGVRFPADARTLTQAGGAIIFIDRPSIGTQDTADLTERERRLIVPDATIINDSGLPELRSTAARVWKDLSKNELVTEYTASKVQA